MKVKDNGGLKRMIWSLAALSGKGTWLAVQSVGQTLLAVSRWDCRCLLGQLRPAGGGAWSGRDAEGAAGVAEDQCRVAVLPPEELAQQWVLCLRPGHLHWGLLGAG